MATNSELKLGDTFQSLSEAKTAINRYQLDLGLSYQVYKSDSMRYISLGVLIQPVASELGLQRPKKTYFL
jgi:hypothetical protein